MNYKYIVLSKSELRRSYKTDGWYFTIVARRLDNNIAYKTYADTTFNSYQSWYALEVGDTFTDVGILNEPKKLMSATNFPRKVNQIESKQFTQPQLTLI